MMRVSEEGLQLLANKVKPTIRMVGNGWQWLAMVGNGWHALIKSIYSLLTNIIPKEHSILIDFVRQLIQYMFSYNCNEVQSKIG